MILSTLTVGHFMDWNHKRRARQNNNVSESRLPPMILGAALIPLGILSFRWSVQYSLHWILPIIFSALVGFGFVSIDISGWSYLVDAFWHLCCICNGRHCRLAKCRSRYSALGWTFGCRKNRIGLGLQCTCFAGFLDHTAPNSVDVYWQAN